MRFRFRIWGMILTPSFQVRHAQGIHNVDGEKNYKAYMSHEYFDAELTQLGWQQVRNKTSLADVKQIQHFHFSS